MLASDAKCDPCICIAYDTIHGEGGGSDKAKGRAVLPQITCLFLRNRLYPYVYGVDDEYQQFYYYYRNLNMWLTIDTKISGTSIQHSVQIYVNAFLVWKSVP